MKETCQFSKYDPATGQIVCSGEVPESMLALQGAHVIAGHFDSRLYYVKDGQVLPRPRMAVQSKGLDIQGLPIPCVIQINQTEYPCNDGVAKLTLPYPGRYVISVKAFPYQDKQWEIEV